MDISTILIIITLSLVGIILVAILIFIFLLLKTLKDIKELINVSINLSKEIQNGNYSKVIHDPLVKDKLTNIISGRFGLFAPIAGFLIKKYFI